MMSRIAAPMQALIAKIAAGFGRRHAGATGGDTGFTLIEVVVALAVVAVSLTAIGAVAATSARGTRSMEQHLALVETTRIVAATLPRNSQTNNSQTNNPQVNNTQASLDGLSGEILGHRWRISLAPFIGSGVYQPPESEWIPQTVIVRVRSPSGAVFGFETVRLQRKAPPQ